MMDAKYEIQILNQIIDAQLLLQSFSEVAKLRGFVIQQFKSIEGIDSCCICLRNTESVCGDNIPGAQEIQKDLLELPNSENDFSPHITKIKNQYVFNVKTTNRMFGYIIIQIKNKQVFDHLFTALSSFVNSFALHLENFQQKNQFYSNHQVNLLKKNPELKNEALHESEEKFKLAFQTSPDSINITRLTDGIIVEVNDGFPYITGFTKEEALGMKTEDLELWANPEDRNILAAQLKETGKVENFEFLRKRKDGEILYSTLFASLLKIKGVPHLISVIRDIDKRKKAEKEIVLSNENYRSLFNDSPIPLWEEDLSELLSYLNELKQKGINDFSTYFDNNPEELKACSAKIKIIDVNKATLNLHHAKNKEELLDNLDKIFTEKSFLIFKEEVIAIVGGITEFESEAEVKTLTGELRYIHLKFKIDQSEKGVARAILATLDITERKQSEIKLKSSEERLRLATEFANVAVWEFDFRNNNMTRSKNHDLLYGLEYKEKWDFENYQKCTHPDDWEYTNEMIQKSTAPGGSGKYKFDFRVVYPDLTIHWLNVTGIVVERNENGEAIVVRGTLIDVTDRKQKEDAIKQKSKDLTTLLEISQTLTTKLNMESVLQNLVNRATNLIGLDTGAIYLVKGQDLYLRAATPPIPPDFPDEFRHALLIDHPHINKSLSSGLPVIIPDLNTADLTPAEKAIKETRSMRSLLYVPLLIENRANGVLILGTDKEVREFSEAEINLYRTMSGQAAMAIYNSQLFEEVKKLNQELENRVGERTDELTNSQAALLNLVEDLNEKSEQLEQSTRLLETKNKELETFTYSVSHDLKAPLRGIDGYSKLLQDSYKTQLDGEANIFLTNIRESAHKMNELIHDLLEYSRLERSQESIEKLRIKHLIQTITSIYKKELDAGNFDLIITIDDIEIEADSKGISIALRNLIENSIKFTTGKPNPTITIGMEEGESSWILSVKDNGIGFDMKYKKKIFDIFQRLHRVEEFPGTGIGLAMVNKAMQRMNGKVRAMSSPGNGATFYLEIPKTI